MVNSHSGQVKLQNRKWSVTSSRFCSMNTRSRPPPANVAMIPLLRPALLGAPPVPVGLAGLGICWTMTASYAATDRRGRRQAWASPGVDDPAAIVPTCEKVSSWVGKPVGHHDPSSCDGEGSFGRGRYPGGGGKAIVSIC